MPLVVPRGVTVPKTFELTPEAAARLRAKVRQFARQQPGKWSYYFDRESGLGYAVPPLGEPLF